MPYHAIKQEMDTAVRAWLEYCLKDDLEFTGNYQTHWFDRQGIEDLRHPSVLVSCEDAPVVQEDMGIHKCEVDVFVTSQAVNVAPDGTEIDASQAHTDRVGLVEDIIMDRSGTIDSMKDWITANYPNLIIYDVLEISGFQGMQADQHWVDKCTLYVHGQILAQPPA